MGLADGPELREEFQFTQRQEKILHWFRQNRAPELAGLYSGAVIMLNDPRFPGRVRFIGHAVREIRNELPNVVDGPTVPEPVQYKKELDRISKAWEENVVGPRLGDRPEAFGGVVDEDAQVGIRAPLFEMLDNLVQRHRKGGEKRRDAERRLIKAGAPETALSERDMVRAVDRWHDILLRACYS